MSLIAVSYPEISSKDFNWIQSLRKKYDKDGFNLLNPHFTLVFPVTEIKQTDFSNHIVLITRNISKIDFTLKQAVLSSNIFEGKWFIFLTPDIGKEEIIELHDLLYSGVLATELSAEFRFTPHITVGCSEDKGWCLEIINKLNKIDISIKGQIHTIDIATYENNQIETISKINLI